MSVKTEFVWAKLPLLDSEENLITEVPYLKGVLATFDGDEDPVEVMRRVREILKFIGYSVTFVSVVDSARAVMTDESVIRFDVSSDFMGRFRSNPSKIVFPVIK